MAHSLRMQSLTAGGYGSRSKGWPFTAGSPVNGSSQEAGAMNADAQLNQLDFCFPTLYLAQDPGPCDGDAHIQGGAFFLLKPL